MSRRMLSVATLALLIAMSLLVAPAQGAAMPSKKQWIHETYTAMSGSRTWLKGALPNAGKHPAITLDIDNTSLASHYAPGEAVAVVLRFVKYADAKGVTILFITGRRDTARKSAVASLRKVGFKVGSYCGRKDGEGLAAGKQRCRAYYTKRGHVILANVGNRATDFTGGDYQRAFKLPNYGNQLS